MTLYEDIVEFVAKQVGVDRERLRPDTTLQQLGLDGDDAAEFMTAFARRFGLDLRGFNFRNHFGPEAAFNPVVWLGWKLIGRKTFTPIHISDLVGAAETKGWDQLQSSPAGAG
jgi:acyl carrier protein